MAKHWISGAISHPGALHREMHVPEGQKIPQTKLEAAASKGGKLGQRARLAETLEHMHHAGDKSATHGLDPQFSHGAAKSAAEIKATRGDGDRGAIATAITDHWGC